MNSTATVTVTVTADLEARQAGRAVRRRTRGTYSVGELEWCAGLASVGMRAALQDADRIAPSMPRLW